MGLERCGCGDLTMHRAEAGDGLLGKREGNAMRPARRHRRVIKRLEIEFSARGSSFRSISSDISRDGLFVRTSRPFAVNTEVELILHLPDNVVSKITGLVRWAVKKAGVAAKNGMGIEIIKRDRHFNEYLNSLVPSGEQIDHNDDATATAPAGAERAPAETLHADPPKGRKESEDEAIDSLITGLFSKKKER